MRKKIRFLTILTTFLFLSACASPETTVVEEAPVPVADAPETDKDPGYLDVIGRTEDNRAFRGNPDAPVVLTDFTDFM